MREKEFQQQRKPVTIACRLPDQCPPTFLAQLRECTSRERPVRDSAIVSCQPGLSDFLVELMLGINGRQIRRPPRARIKGRLHSQWIQLRHSRKFRCNFTQNGTSISWSTAAEDAARRP